MQAWYPAEFEREMGCTETEWLGWLPGAVGRHKLHLGQGSATVIIDTGALSLQWEALPPRTIALIRLPRQKVVFRFAGLPDDDRQRFMRLFDLYMQRGGG